jgi:protein transport protein SEC24
MGLAPPPTGPPAGAPALAVAPPAQLAPPEPTYGGFGGTASYDGYPATPGGSAGTAGAAPAGGGVAAGAGVALDETAQCGRRFMRATVGALHNSSAAAAKARVPLGIVLRPLASAEAAAGDGGDTDGCDVVNFGATGIVRCKRCRTYINPFVAWLDSGRRWRCNICGLPNDGEPLRARSL